jgi:two-component sensor histidine kinase
MQDLPHIGLEGPALRIAERYAPAFVIADENFRILHFSGGTGRYIEPVDGAMTLDLLGLVHRDIRLELRTALSRAVETNEPAHAEQVQLGINGHRVLVDITVEPVLDGPSGHRNFVVLFKDGPVHVIDRNDSNLNVLVRTEHVERLESELRTTRERLQAAIAELESLNERLKSPDEEYQSLNEELRRRVRNALGVVRSIARRSSETSTSVEDYAAHLDGRLNAFARTQALVTLDLEGGVDLEYLVVEEMLGYNAREGEQLHVSGPPVRFQPKAAETFALAIHELATNAIKYGALSLPKGNVDVSWRVDEAANPPQLVLDWRERGGPRVGPPQRKGFGAELLEKTLAFELKGKTMLNFDPSGLQCTIAIPLNRQVVHTPAVGA